MIFDLLIGFLLLNRRTFWPAAAMLVLFHLVNNALFQIGIFPLVGIGLIAIFFCPDGPRRFFQKLEKKDPSHSAKTAIPATHQFEPTLTSPLITTFIIAFLAIQCLLPFRYLAYGDQNPSWTGIGHFSSWRMMLQNKAAAARFYFTPPEAARLLEKPGVSPELGGSQLQRMGTPPLYLLQ